MRFMRYSFLLITASIFLTGSALYSFSSPHEQAIRIERVCKEVGAQASLPMTGATGRVPAERPQGIGFLNNFIYSTLEKKLKQAKLTETLH